MGTEMLSPDFEQFELGQKTLPMDTWAPWSDSGRQGRGKLPWPWKGFLSEVWQG